MVLQPRDRNIFIDPKLPFKDDSKGSLLSRFFSPLAIDKLEQSTQPKLQQTITEGKSPEGLIKERGRRVRGIHGYRKEPYRGLSDGPNGGDAVLNTNLELVIAAYEGRLKID